MIFLYYEIVIPKYIYTSGTINLKYKKFFLKKLFWIEIFFIIE